MIPLPPEKAGADNDLNEKIERYIKRAIEEKAIIYAFGERWGPEENTPDSYFHFKPGNGIHDIHMNQGNVEKWQGDDGIWQDGGILIHFEKEEEWIGIFLAFQSQSWCTDEEGHARVPVEHCDYKGIINKKRAFKRTPSSYFIKRKLTSVERQENSSATLENAMRYILYFITCPIS